MSKSLNQLAHEARSFGSIYRVPARTNLCPPASVNVSASQRPLPQAPSVVNSLNRIASDVLQFGFVYPDTRILFTEKKPDFLVRRRIEPETPDISGLKELNRLARLVELSSKSETQPPIYPVWTPSSPGVRTHQYGKGFPCPFTQKLRSHLKLSREHTFAQAFPRTTVPKSFSVLGQKKLLKHEFNLLLVPKLDQARRFLKRNATPEAIPRLVSSWINSLLSSPELSKKQTPSKKDKTPKTKSSSTEDQRTLSFVPATEQNPTSAPVVQAPANDDTTPSSSHDIFHDCLDLRGPLKKASVLYSFYVRGDIPDLSPVLTWLDVKQLSSQFSTPINGVLAKIVVSYGPSGLVISFGNMITNASRLVTLDDEIGCQCYPVVSQFLNSVASAITLSVY